MSKLSTSVTNRKKVLEAMLAWDYRFTPSRQVKRARRAYLTAPGAWFRKSFNVLSSNQITVGCHRSGLEGRADPRPFERYTRHIALRSDGRSIGLLMVRRRWGFWDQLVWRSRLVGELALNRVLELREFRSNMCYFSPDVRNSVKNPVCCLEELLCAIRCLG